MLQKTYRQRLGEDVPRWREKGWVTNDGAAAILADLGEAPAGFGLPQLMAVLGALLLGFGVIAFVAANWEDMPRLIRFALILVGLAIAYGAAYALERRKLFFFAEAAFLLAGLLFAGAIALIGQAYHLSGDFTGAVLFFEIATLIAALLVRSNALIALVLLGAGYLTYQATAEFKIVPYWEGLALILVAGAVAVWFASAAARIAAVLALFFWIGITVIGVADALDWPFGGAAALLLATALAFWALGSALAAWAPDPRLEEFGAVLLWPSLLLVMVFAGLLQAKGFFSHYGPDQTWLWLAIIAAVIALLLTLLAVLKGGATPVDLAAVLVLAVGAIAIGRWELGGEIAMRFAGGLLVVVAALWAVSIGQSPETHRAKSLGLTVFGLEVLYLYTVTLGTILDTALAFLLGGVLFIGLSFLLFRIDRRLAARQAKGAA